MRNCLYKLTFTAALHATHACSTVYGYSMRNQASASHAKHMYPAHLHCDFMLMIDIAHEKIQACRDSNFAHRCVLFTCSCRAQTRVKHCHTCTQLLLVLCLRLRTRQTPLQVINACNVHNPSQEAASLLSLQDRLRFRGVIQCSYSSAHVL